MRASGSRGRRHRAGHPARSLRGDLHRRLVDQGRIRRRARGSDWRSSPSVGQLGGTIDVQDGLGARFIVRIPTATASVRWTAAGSGGTRGAPVTMGELTVLWSTTTSASPTCTPASSAGFPDAGSRRPCTWRPGLCSRCARVPDLVLLDLSCPTSTASNSSTGSATAPPAPPTSSRSSRWATCPAPTAAAPAEWVPVPELLPVTRVACRSRCASGGKIQVRRRRYRTTAPAAWATIEIPTTAPIEYP